MALTQDQINQQVVAAGYNGPMDANSVNAAYARTATPSDLVSSGVVVPNAANTTTPTSSTSTASQVQQLSSGIQNLLNAQASGNKAAFDETVREFNQSFGLDQQKFQNDVDQANKTFGLTQAATTGTYNGSPTQAAIKQANDIAVANAALTGQFNGAPTQAALAQQAGLSGYYGGVAPGSMSWDQLSQQLQATGGGTYNDAAAKAQFQALTGQHPNNFNGSTPLGLSQQQINAIASAAGVNPTALQGQQTMAMQQQTYAQQMGLIAAAQTAQANPFRQQQLYQQAQSMFGGTPVAGFSAPSTVAGVGTAGGNTQGGMGYVQQMIDDIRSPAANQTSADDFMAATPTPNKIDSTSFLRSNPTTQNIILQSMQEKYGIDPTDALQQIKNTLPAFSAPATTGTVRRG